MGRLAHRCLGYARFCRSRIFCEAVAQLAARSRLRTVQDAARERNRVARLDALQNRLDRGRLAFQLDLSANNCCKLQRLLRLLNSPVMANLKRG